MALLRALSDMEGMYGKDGKDGKDGRTGRRKDGRGGKEEKGGRRKGGGRDIPPPLPAVSAFPATYPPPLLASPLPHCARRSGSDGPEPRRAPRSFRHRPRQFGRS